MQTSPTCLILDSDIDHIAVVTEFCERRGWNVTSHNVSLGEKDSVEDSELARCQELAEGNDWDAAFIDTVLGVAPLKDLANGNLRDSELFAMSATDNSEVADACIRSGYSYYFCKPFAEDNVGALLDDIREEASTPHPPEDTVDPACALDQFGLMRGSSRAMRKLFRLLRKIGPTETTALIVGESGTGKELVAETLHAVSSRADKPYLTLNCSALAENLIESELFGHEKGSFSGAHKRHPGFFERAHGGTLFLDEVTEMLPDLQAKLLRALESGEIRRVGAVEPIKVDVRVVAATNRDPQEAVEQGHLREDLYYRLAHITIHVPPLRRRGSDICGLAQFFLMQLNEQHKTSLTISEEALDALQQYEWPGNVRQLRHAVERAYIVSEGEIERDAFLLAGSSGADSGDLGITLGMSLREVEERVIMATLEQFEGDKKETAAILGISLKTLYNRLREYEDAEPDEKHDKP